MDRSAGRSIMPLHKCIAKQVVGLFIHRGAFRIRPMDIDATDAHIHDSPLGAGQHERGTV
jgi:hypothetical protein